MSKSRTAAVLLAAGRGTRMKSALPKVLHPVAGRPMIGYLLDRLAVFQPERTVVVVSPGMPAVAEFVAPAQTVIQDPPLGTGHAVMAARASLDGFDGDVLVLFADTPLLTAATMQSLVAARRGAGDPAVVVLGFRPDDPGDYGRLITTPDGGLQAIVEAKDADAAQREIGLCNAGIMAIDGKRLFDLLDAVGNDNAKGEYYLTDIIEIARSLGWGCTVVETDDPFEVMGVNSRAGLAEAEAAMQDRLRSAAMADGVTLTAPQTVWFCHDTKLGRDVSIGPNVVFGSGVSVGDNVEIQAFCHIDGATIENGATVGPFARLRPGADIGANVRIGNFVEIKAARLDEGATDGATRQAIAQYFADFGAEVKSVSNERQLKKLLSCKSGQLAEGADIICDAHYSQMLLSWHKRRKRQHSPFHMWLLLQPEQRRELRDLLEGPAVGYLLKPVRRGTLLEQFVERDKILIARAAATLRSTAIAGNLKTGGGLHILLAEDNQINALLATTLLSKAGHSYHRATNGAEAVDYVKKAMAKGAGAPQWPDLALMDVTMPDMNGLEATRMIRALEKEAGSTRPLPILALTANAHREDRETCLAAGMSGFMPKPFDRADLEEAIAELTNKHAA